MLELIRWFFSFGHYALRIHICRIISSRVAESSSTTPNTYLQLPIQYMSVKINYKNFLEMSDKCKEICFYLMQNQNHLPKFYAPLLNFLLCTVWLKTWSSLVNPKLVSSKVIVRKYILEVYYKWNFTDFKLIFQMNDSNRIRAALSLLNIKPGLLLRHYDFEETGRYRKVYLLILHYKTYVIIFHKNYWHSIQLYL